MFANLRRWILLLSLLAMSLLGGSAWAQSLININTASAEELETLPGIGATKANAIIAFRESHGGFTSVDQLNDVEGIGDSTMAQIRDLVTLGDGTPTQTPPPTNDDDDDDDDNEQASVENSGEDIDLTNDSGSSVHEVADSTRPEDTDNAESDQENTPPPPTPTGGLVNINTASAAELEELPGIGPTKATAIIEYRTTHGPFTSVDQLDDVPGIGPSTMASLRELVTVQ